MSQKDLAWQGSIGLLGLGNMGAALAARLALRFPVIAYDPDRSRAMNVADKHGTRIVGTPNEVAEAKIVVLSLPTPTISQQSVELLAGKLAPGSVILETSTVTPEDIHRAQAHCEKHSIGLVDAAILSGVQQMYDGDSTLLLGGESVYIDAVQPVLDTLAARHRHLGPSGSGMAAKVINNAVAHAVMVILVEAGALAAASSIPRADLAELLSSPDGGLIRPLTHRFTERILSGDYEGGMPAEAARKDSLLALQLAQASKTPLFAIHAAHTVYELALSSGLSRHDYSAIATLWEGWTGRPLGDSPQSHDGSTEET